MYDTKRDKISCFPSNVIVREIIEFRLLQIKVTVPAEGMTLVDYICSEASICEFSSAEFTSFSCAGKLGCYIRSLSGVGMYMC